MLEDFEGLENLGSSLDSASEGLTDIQKEYLAELNIEPEDWAELNTFQQEYNLDIIDGRMEELGVPVDQRSELGQCLFNSDLSEAYDYYLAREHESPEGTGHEKLEAPQDHLQIEQISEVLSDCEDLKYENWVNIELPEKEAVLNSLEERIAEIEHRPPCPVHLKPLDEGLWGGYNPVTKDITINSNYAEMSDYGIYKEMVDTLIHEGRHAYQDFNVNVAEIHPRHSEVASWAENMEGGKWGYWGDCSTILGQRLYEQQSIEIDARNFAADILDKLNLKA